ncbi:MAG: BrnA antitoxin family protein [Nitrospirales bacterium]|nr:BrnA antitoxin family protein [Nitrospirales bacterium]
MERLNTYFQVRHQLFALRVRGPQKAPKKVSTTVRLSQDIVDFFKKSGRGWQTKINEALKEYVKSHS